MELCIISLYWQASRDCSMAIEINSFNNDIDLLTSAQHCLQEIEYSEDSIYIRVF